MIGSPRRNQFSFFSIGLPGIAIFFGFALFVPRGFAAQTGKIDVDKATLYEGPGQKFKKVFDVPRGVVVEASNVPVEGFYKVRLPNGRVGWLSSDTLNFGPKKPASPTIRYETTPEAVSVNTEAGQKKKKSQDDSRSVSLGLLGGLNIFKVSDINSLFTFSDMSNGLGFGGELVFYPNANVGIVVRFEKISRFLHVEDRDTSLPYDFRLSSLPFLFGAEIPLSKTANSGLALDILVGIAASTEFSSTATTYSADHVTTYSGTGLSALFKFDYTLALSSGFGLFGELGYRYLKTGSISPGLAANGSNIFKDVNGNPISIAIDMSGPVLGGGLRFTF